ncbi:MAG: hypothetical protein QME96_11155 [Myxococcota bacterium]|nr:hypothetical protein [Myxococcota bacterium]
MAEELERWRRMLRWKRLRPLQAFWGMPARHMDGVLAWARHHLIYYYLRESSRGATISWAFP